MTLTLQVMEPTVGNESTAHLKLVRMFNREAKRELAAVVDCHGKTAAEIQEQVTGFACDMVRRLLTT